MLFGHQNDDAGQTAQTTVASGAVGVNPLAVDPTTGASLPAVPPNSHPQTASLEESSVLNQPSPNDTASAAMPAAPLMPPPPAPEPEAEVSEPVVSQPAPVEPSQPVGSPSLPASDSIEPAGDDLLTIKQQALEQLGPLVDHLEQTPEEKFRTTMMLIQSTDNPSRLQDAYDAAQAIPDEKVRAQALLDVINEINYFTQKGGN